MKKLISLFLALLLIFSLSVSAFAASQDVSQPDLKSGWSVSSSGSITNPSGYNNSWFRALLNTLITLNNTVVGTSSSGMDYTLERIYTDLVLGGTGSTKNNLASLVTNTGHLSEIRTNTASAKSNLTTIATRLAYAGTGIGEITHDILTNTNSIKSDLSSSKGLLSYIKDDVAHLEEVLADDDDKALKDDNKDNQLKAQEEFFGDGANSVSTDNLGSLSGLVSAFRSFLGDDIGLGTLNLAGWEQITSSDDPWLFFTDGDQIAEDMGVTASPVASPDFSDPDNPGGVIPDIPDNPPDEDDFPDDGRHYIHLINVHYSYDFTYEDSSVSYEASDLSSDVFIPLDARSLCTFAIGRVRGDSLNTAYSVSINGLFFDGNELTGNATQSFLEVDFSDNVTIEFFEPVSSIKSVRQFYFDFSYVPPVSNSAPRLLLQARPDPNAVVTSYYEDNKNALRGWLH